MNDLIEKAHAYLGDKGCKSIGQKYTSFEIEKMLAEFAQQQLNLLNIPVVMPRFSESEIEQMAYEWSSERSVGDAEQDSQCMYDYAQGMKAMQRLLLNGA